jgi:hypothetical protein
VRVASDERGDRQGDDQADWNVDIEDRLPADCRGQHASEQDACCRPDAHDCTQESEGLAAVLREGEELGDESESSRRH